MFEVWRTNANKTREIEKIGTFERKIYAHLVCDYMVQHGGDEYILKEIKEREPLTKEKVFEDKFKNKLANLQKDFASKERDYDFDFER